MNLKTLRTLALCGAATLGAVGAQAENATGYPVETRAYYSTNASEAVGKASAITIDGKLNEWTDDMIVATCGANDVANAFKGSHENCVLDLYAVYASWDDSNLYLAWQMCNTGDTWARPGDGPLTDSGRIGDVPLIVALSVDPSAPGMTGKLDNGNFIWSSKSSNGVEFSSHVDHLFFMSGKVGLGEPAMFTAVDASGNTNYGSGCHPFASNGIRYAMAEGFAPSHLWRQRTTADWADPTTLLSDPEIINNIYDAANYDNLKAGLPEGLKQHDYSYDSFYEMSIPLSLLGIDREWLEANGIGVRVVATRGESGLDCCPFDPSMVDNVFGEYGADNSTSHEKDDIDIITYALASVGKMRTGEVGPLPNPNPNPNPDPNPGPDPTPEDGNYVVYFDNASTGWNVVKTWIWDAADGNRNFTGGTWPGADMTLDAETGYWFYSFTCEAAAPKLMCIFNNGSDQTADLELINRGIYTRAGYTGQNVSGIENVAAEVALSVDGLSVASAQPLRLYTIAGVCIGEGTVVTAPSHGLYIALVGGKARKLAL